MFTQRAPIAGEWVGAGPKSFEVRDPFDGAVLAVLPDLGVDETRRAIKAASAVQKDWAKKTAKERAGVLKRWHDLVIENADDLAAILTAEQGKPLAE
uniref:aldehyde dehydrogenase family protein n=1 Tax=Aureimonas psammosilenae TaxID=2495496 RepID=UPI0012605769